MKKRINKILYFFGYAPIRISHEVRDNFVSKEINFYDVRVVEYIYQRDFMIMNDDKIRDVLRKKLLKEIENHIIFSSTQSIKNDYVVASANLYVGKIK